MSWERAELDWQMALWESTPAPWPEHVLLPWLRYVDGCLLRGARYYVPERCCGQVRKAASVGEVPGRRAIREVSGCSEWDARRYRDALAETDPAKCVEPWRDPYRRRADPADRVRELEAEIAELRAGFSRVPPASLPPTSRVTAEESALNRTAPPAPLPPLSRLPPDRALTPRASTGSPDHLDPNAGGVHARTCDDATSTPADTRPPAAPEPREPDPPPMWNGRPVPYTLDELFPDGRNRPSSAAMMALARQIQSPETLLAMTYRELSRTPGIGGLAVQIRMGLRAMGWELATDDEPTDRSRGSPRDVAAERDRAAMAGVAHLVETYNLNPRVPDAN